MTAVPPALLPLPDAGAPTVGLPTVDGPDLRPETAQERFEALEEQRWIERHDAAQDREPLGFLDIGGWDD